MKQESLPHEKSLKLKTETKNFTTNVYGQITFDTGKWVISARVTSIANSRVEVYFNDSNRNYATSYTGFSSGAGTLTRFNASTTYNIEYVYLIEE